MRATLVLRGEI